MWIPKRLDVLRLKGKFEGCSRSVALSYMRNPRMLFLGTVTDENDISTVLGKCHVIRNSPRHDSPGKYYSAEKNQEEEGSFLCDFDISITPASGKGDKDKITVVPFKPPSSVVGDVDVTKPDSEEDTSPPTKKCRTASSLDSDDNDTLDATSVVVTESMSIEDAPYLNGNTNGDNEEEEEEESSMEEVIKEPNELKAPTTEGSATQKIMVGEHHQAVIPPLAMNHGGKHDTDRDAPPMLVWKPDSISDKKLQKFMEDVEQLLVTHMKNKNIDHTRIVPPDLDSRRMPSSSFKCREIKTDQVLKLLHDKSYNTEHALKVIKASPQIYLDNWTRREKELYNAGFKRHYSAIRLIAKEVGPTKTHKDVVDYHYRYKIPYQFQRYQDKKRELARRMLDCVEKHRMGDLSSAGTPQFVNNSSGSGPKKFHSW
jgi:ELM2 domain.